MPSAVISETSPTSATFDASRTRWNIDSPANSPPIATPYSPPASSPSRHASTECAQPSRCSSLYAAAMSRVIHPASRAGSPQRGHHLVEGGVDPDLEVAGSDRRSDRDTTSPSSGTIPRGTGENQCIGGRTPCSGIGKIPLRYAASRVPGARSAPIADQVVLRVPRVREDPRGGWRLDRHSPDASRL